MITLNILPTKQKKEIKIKYLFRSLKNFFSVVLILLVAYSMALLTIKFFLQLHFIKTIQETTLITKSTQNYSKRVYDINTQINAAQAIQGGHYYWSYLTDYIATNLSPDITLSKISLNKDNDTLVLTGQSGSRESLLKLKETMEKSGQFSAIDFPISNLLKKDNISFEITTKLKNYDFKSLQK